MLTWVISDLNIQARCLMSVSSFDVSNAESMALSSVRLRSWLLLLNSTKFHNEPYSNQRFTLATWLKYFVVLVTNQRLAQFQNGHGHSNGWQCRWTLFTEPIIAVKFHALPENIQNNLRMENIFQLVHGMEFTSFNRKMGKTYPRLTEFVINGRRFDKEGCQVSQVILDDSRV